MTIPDELVQAAAEALHVFTRTGICECGYHTSNDPALVRRHLAELALQAAFAKLPEPKEVKRLAYQAAYASVDRNETGAASIADSVLAALAREFGGQE